MRLKRDHARWVAVASVLALLVVRAAMAAQSMDGTGAVATGLLLRQMDGVKRVLMIGAHPDDEDTSLLTTLARGWGAETAYLSLTRGDGGQNLIGSELWEGLGIIRTGELVAARSLDGGRQFFTRAFDYGYSKSAEEALSLWPREDLLADVVVGRALLSAARHRVRLQRHAPRRSRAASGGGHHRPRGLRGGGGARTDSPSSLHSASCRGRSSRGPRTSSISRLAVVSSVGVGVGVAMGVPTTARSPSRPVRSTRSSDARSSSYRWKVAASTDRRTWGAAQPPGPRSTGVVLVESRVEDDGATIFLGRRHDPRRAHGVATGRRPRDDTRAPRGVSRLGGPRHRGLRPRPLGDRAGSRGGIPAHRSGAASCRKIGRHRVPAGDRSEEGSGQSGTLRRRRNLFRCPGYGRPAGAGVKPPKFECSSGMAVSSSSGYLRLGCAPPRGGRSRRLPSRDWPMMAA